MIYYLLWLGTGLLLYAITAYIEKTETPQKLIYYVFP